ncbi:sulfatase-like hydrolase/transferase [Pseudomonas putida]|uniref:sulfatase-like hydrolase/transferase n=1 Tax=Pseudomonas putida TaxID=303 RepID=UPI0022643149|nr:sulfatase-like hydrolase/transferase [Pseudomonas putida]
MPNSTSPAFAVPASAVANADKPLKLFLLSFVALYLLLVLATPLALTSFEDDASGLDGYLTLYATTHAVVFVAYLALLALLARFAPRGLLQMLSVLGLWALLVAGVYSFLLPLDAGMIDNFRFSEPQAMTVSGPRLLLDLAVAVATLGVALLLVRRFAEQAGKALTLFVLICAAYALFSGVTLASKIAVIPLPGNDGKQTLSFSKTEQNIVVLMIDGSMAGYIPRLLEHDAQAAERLSGFTWYSNVVSTGNRTFNALPAVFGGFDYTAGNINKLPGDSLEEKVDQAYMLYPDNFTAKGYGVRYVDPFWYGFARRGDCDKFIAKGAGDCIHLIDTVGRQQTNEHMSAKHAEYLWGVLKQYLAISLYKAAPNSLKGQVYDAGNWQGASLSWWKREDKFLENYFSLLALPALSDTQAPGPTFTFMANNITRAVLKLDESCVPNKQLGTTAQELSQLHSQDTVEIYDTFYCAMNGVTRYLDWFRQQGIYDNTMFVLVSDHGWPSRNPLLKAVGNAEQQELYSQFQNLLMIKPFAAKGAPRESREFISNASVPGIVCEVIGGCVDRSTGKHVRYQPLTEPVQLYETPWQPQGQNADSYKILSTYEVKDDVSVPGNWSKLQ